ncbi:MAG: M56 family metallopeptidase, partial [Clostridiales bacterium]|nr:M56 family metallopeptidase [Clostridiales bacterium]
MKAIVDALVQVTLYSAAITAGILLFRFIFKNRISSKLQYLMWWLLILRLLMPVTPDIGLHFNLQDMLLKQAHQAELPTPAPVLDVTPASVPSTQSSYESVAPAVQPDTDVAPSQHVNPAKSTDWYSIVFVVWLLGAIGFLGWLIFVKLRYYESLQHLMADGPREAYELYDKCCKELGVKPLPLWIVNKSMSPGIAFFGEPVLLVPLSLCNNESRLRFALLHELTHKKRGDHYMTLLLNILRAVYWFDPVVHFAFSELRSDMESACDSDVLAYIGHEHKRGYLTVILDMFSYDTEPILGMSQIRSKRMAKRRMKGAFMKNRTSPVFRAITLCLALAMSVCCLTTACQSAPEKVPPHMAAEQTADPSPEPTLIPEPSAQEPEAIAYTPDAFDRTDPE